LSSSGSLGSLGGRKDRSGFAVQNHVKRKPSCLRGERLSCVWPGANRRSAFAVQNHVNGKPSWTSCLRTFVFFVIGACRLWGMWGGEAFAVRSSRFASGAWLGREDGSLGSLGSDASAAERGSRRQGGHGSRLRPWLYSAGSASSAGSARREQEMNRRRSRAVHGGQTPKASEGTWKPKGWPHGARGQTLHLALRGFVVAQHGKV
jgi:hypothetical protein